MAEDEGSAASEDDVTEGLTLWDMNRPVRKVDPSGGPVTLDRQWLTKVFECPVCLSAVHNACAVRDCMHRFCSPCIEKSLRLSKKECPTCRLTLKSRRVLIADPRFDRLVEKLLPDRDETERKRTDEAQAAMARSIEVFGKAAEMGYKRQREMAMKLQQQQQNGTAKSEAPSDEEEEPRRGHSSDEGESKSKRKKASASVSRRSSPAPSVSPLTTRSLSPSTLSSAAAAVDGGSVSLVLKAKSATAALVLERQYVAVSGKASVRALCEYIGTALSVGAGRIAVFLPGAAKPLEFDTALGHLARLHTGSELELMYEVAPESSS